MDCVVAGGHDNPDVWIQPAIKSDGSTYYEYMVLLYIRRHFGAIYVQSVVKNVEIICHIGCEHAGFSCNN